MYYLKRKKSLSSKPKSKKSNLVAKLDKIFAHYIRLRDVLPSGYFICISCSQIKPFDQSDCGHFFSRTHMATRFSELNCHSECRACNRFSADHLVGYQRNLIARIGEQKFNLLSIEHSKTKKWSDFELEQMINYYKQEVARLSKEKNIKV